ncbi:MAG TPA: hypothetical protein PK280_16480 [Planctomycetota bacterium]|nr:hypothetical protein [Planctomycetota bacterium]
MAAAAAVVVLAAGLTATALAWWPYGHWTVTRAAAEALPQDVPEFFRKAGGTLAFYTNDPDLWTEGKLPVSLRPSQMPEHFIDYDLLRGRKLPVGRAEFGALCRELQLDPDKVGWLPYAIRDWHDRLTIAFAEHRKWPADERVKAKVLYIGGILSHFTADAAQPLHSTVHFDGKAGPGGKSPRSGIHFKVDALPDRAGLKAGELAKDLDIPELPDAFAAAVAAIEESAGKVDKVYELEAALPAPTGPPPEKLDPAVREFALARCRAAVRLTAGLWLSAWQASAKVKLPEWHQVPVEK